MTAAAEELRAPFPYFGAKHRAAPIIWAALGDPGGYVEPFAGSAAVLLARPPFKGRRVETLNDADGWLVNMWRAIQHDPARVAQHAWGPITELDYHARLAWLEARRDRDLTAWLAGDPEHYDAKAAGWWLYVIACGIGDPFGGGPWVVQDGKMVDARKLPDRAAAGPGIHRSIPDVGTPGRGVARTSYNHQAHLEAYMAQLSARLQRVRITCGSYERLLKPSAHTATAGGDGATAMLLDPPYTVSGDLYAASRDDEGDISAAVRDWCIRKAPKAMRTILCGFENEHDELLEHGWTVVEGKAGSGNGYNKDAAAGKRERLWMSPACIIVKQDSLW